jgi:hypothetical protein
VWRTGGCVTCPLCDDLKSPSIFVMTVVAENVDTSVLFRFLKRLFKKKKCLELFFTSRNTALDIVLQPIVPIGQENLPIER